MGQACRVLGWAIAQTVTLLAPDVVVIGGGVSLLGKDLFFAPVRQSVRHFVFPPLAESTPRRTASWWSYTGRLPWLRRQTD